MTEPGYANWQSGATQNRVHRGSTPRPGTSPAPKEGARSLIDASHSDLSSIEVTSYTRAGLHAALIEGQREARRVAVSTPVGAALAREHDGSTPSRRVASTVAQEPLEQAIRFRIPTRAYVYGVLAWVPIIAVVIALKGV